MPTPPIDYHALAAKHGATSSVAPYVAHESQKAVIPPELERIQNAIGVQYKLGKPVSGSDSIASVGEHEPHVIQINDKARWNQGPQQVKGHEIIHLWASNLPPKIRAGIPLDDPDPKKRYDISDVDKLRSSGHTLATIPQEQAATILQTYTADPSQRKRLQEWVSDLNSMPLSVMNPTSPNQKGINTTVRSPVPPIEAYLTPQQMRERAAKINPQANKPATNNPLPSQPKDALNKYPNPESQPPKVSSKPGPYATKLVPAEEQEFRKWAAANPNSIRGEVGPAPNFDPIPTADYDVRGHFHAAKIGDPAATLVPNKWDGKIHGNDRFKTPFNGSFSRESMYAMPNAPRWVGNRLMTVDGKLVTDETPRKPGGQK